MRVYVLGAGASKSYGESVTGERMPIARDFFPTFQRLDLYAHPWVLRDAVVHHLESRGIDADAYLGSGVDVEAFHSEVEAIYHEALSRARTGGDFTEVIWNFRTYTQLTFIFAAVVNAVQNGPPSETHRHLATLLRPDDVILTFNWDTLQDRALAEETAWQPDWGYGFTPRRVFRDGWVDPAPLAAGTTGGGRLFKLHGSTNWITSYPTHERDGLVVLMQTSAPETVYVFESASRPYATYAGRYMPGYAPYSYGYYPPNILDDPGRAAPEGYVFARTRPKYPWVPEGGAGDDGLPSMPLIIPPVREKRYDMFGPLFGQIWDGAEQALSEAEEIVVIGYSFPPTDFRSRSLFRSAFLKRRSMPRVAVIDPAPSRVAEVFSFELGIAATHLTVHEARFTSDLLSRPLFR